jgi:hypothetical protein
MKRQAKFLIGSALAISFCAATSVQAEVQDRIITVSGSPAAQYAQIVDTATAMCREAASQNEVFDVRRCVKIVVAETIAEINQPQLSQFAQAQRDKADS